MRPLITSRTPLLTLEMNHQKYVLPVFPDHLGRFAHWLTAAVRSPEEPLAEERVSVLLW